MSSTPWAGGPPDAKHPGAPQDAPSVAAGVYVEVQGGEEFGRLRSSYRRFAFPMTVGFCAWYLLYVLLSSYAPDLMGTVLFGHINIAFAFGVLQFVSTFLIAWLYARYAGARIDSQAEAIKVEVERRASASGAAS